MLLLPPFGHFFFQRSLARVIPRVSCGDSLSFFPFVLELNILDIKTERYGCLSCSKIIAERVYVSEVHIHSRE